MINETELKKNAVILAIESSCDETAAAVIRGGREILSNEIMSSCTEHVKFGGVVPEIASRAHTLAISKVVDSALKKAGFELNELDAIAVTYGAGLLGALLVGVSYAKALAYASDLPLLPVSHIRGHIAACYLNRPELKPPFVSLLASGGHTAVIYVKDYSDFEILGQTLDDAVGEAFDKVARVLSLDYPGGPNIERLAREGENSIKFPPMLKGEKNFDFSYSGLKTAVINYIHTAEQKGESIDIPSLAASFQKGVVDCLITNLEKVARDKGYNKIVIAGGVSANSKLRADAEKMCDRNNWKLYLPKLKYCGDNAAMIASQGYYEFLENRVANESLNAYATMSIDKSYRNN